MTPEPAPDWLRALVSGESDVIPLMPAGTPSPTPAETEPPRSGIIVIDKPAGVTSFDVVRTVRSASGERRVGHAGTLDPIATGVLVVCIGSATRVVDVIQEQPKHYDAEVTFGVTTDTLDSEGTVTERRDARDLTRAAVEDALDHYRGRIEQVPPMYSALKRGGRPLYELARAGIEVEREPRAVVIHDLRLTSFEHGPNGARSPRATLTMTVSKGTYVRSLAHDLGTRLGTGAHLSGLRRTAVGRFTVDHAVTPEVVVEAFRDGWWPRIVHALDQALLDYSAMVGDAAIVAAASHGQQFDGPPPTADTTAAVRLYGPDGRFVALVGWDRVTERWQPERVFTAT